MQARNAFAFVLFTFLTIHCGPNDQPAPAEDVPRRLTRGECTQGVDHAIALFDAEPAMADAARMMRGGRAGFITQCEAVATVRDHECLMKSRTSYELGLCPLPGTR